MNNLIKSIRLTLVFCVFFTVSYVAILWIFGQIVTPNKGNASVITHNGKVVGAENVGQLFTDSRYFHGRPSCAGDGYDAGSSSGSNKGPTNPAYLQEVETRTVAFLKEHPYLKRSEIPAEMVTASGSGLDPHISPEAAYIQVKRVAQARGLSETEVRAIVDKYVEKPLAGLLGTAKINVLKLNVALDKSKTTKESNRQP